MKSIYAKSVSTLLDAACRILRYLKGVPRNELYDRPSSHLDIVGYSDVDWLGDHIDRHFTSGYCISFMQFGDMVM